MKKKHRLATISTLMMRKTQMKTPLRFCPMMTRQMMMIIF
jgi:hypothetical protein